MSSNSTTSRDLTASRDTEVGWQLLPPSPGPKPHYKVQCKLKKHYIAYSEGLTNARDKKLLYIALKTLSLQTLHSERTS